MLNNKKILILALIIVLGSIVLKTNTINSAISGKSVSVPVVNESAELNQKEVNPVVSSLTPIDINNLPQGADKEYLEAVKIAIAKCGKNLYLVGMTSFGNATKYDHYRFTNGNCPSGILQVTYSHETKTMDNGEILNAGYALGGPINLANWNISSKKAYELLDGTSTTPSEKELFDDKGALVWDVHYQSGGGFMIVHLNALDGTITRNLVYPSL